MLIISLFEKTIFAATILCITCFYSLALSLETADPQASPDAKKILTYFNSLALKSTAKVISGQFLGYASQVPTGYDKEITSMHNKTNKHIALVGTDFAYSGSTAIKTFCDPLIQHWKNGHLVTISYHIPNPNVSNFKEVIANGNYLQTLDDIYERLKYLSDNGVVVLWRPFHEMNGSWFWWGGKDINDFKIVWNHMFDYLTKTKGLHNLLWVFSPDDGPANAAGYFPGDHYCDIVGLDNYNNFSLTLDISQYDTMVKLGKPFGLTEFSPKSSSDTKDQGDYTVLINGGLKTKYPKTTFFFCWDREWGLAYNLNGDKVLNAPWIVNRGDLTWKEVTQNRRSIVRIQPVDATGSEVFFDLSGRTVTERFMRIKATLTIQQTEDASGNYKMIKLEK